jgi:hypothetical protein
MRRINVLTIDVPRNLGRSWRWFVGLRISLIVLKRSESCIQPIRLAFR